MQYVQCVVSEQMHLANVKTSYDVLLKRSLDIASPKQRNHSLVSVHIHTSSAIILRNILNKSRWPILFLDIMYNIYHKHQFQLPVAQFIMLVVTDLFLIL